MRLRTLDGEVQLPTHLVAATKGMEFFSLDVESFKDGKRFLYPRMQIAPEGLYCYDEKDVAKAKKLLEERDCTPLVQALEWPIEQIEKVKGRKYHSRSEAIAHLKGEIEEPESAIIPNLKKKQKEHEEKIKDFDKAKKEYEEKIKDFDKAKKDNGKLQQRIVGLEAMVADLTARLATIEAASKKEV